MSPVRARNYIVLRFPNTPSAFQHYSILCLAALIGFSIGLMTIANARAADIIHVKTVAMGNGDGSSWDNATTLQDALQNRAESGDEIWVTEGVYTPGLSPTDTFSLIPGVAVYGGFAGTETNRSQRDWESNVTVLSGDIGGDDITDANGVVTDTANTVGKNSYHIVFADGTSTPITSDTVLDGFSVTAGATYYLSPYAHGGGFYCDGSDGGECSPKLANIVFSANRASYSNGGAMYNNGHYGVSNPILDNVDFNKNKASKGGAMLNYGIDGESSPILTNVRFTDNYA